MSPESAPELPLLQALHLRNGSPGSIAVLRHSARLPIAEATLEAAFATPLTDEGRTRATALGAALPRHLPVRVWHSPAPRCADTAACLAEGLLAQGGEVAREGEWGLLGGEFIRDADAVVRAFTERGARGFFRAWDRGELGASVVADLPRAAETLVRAVLQAGAPPDPPSLRLHVTHDVVIVALLAAFCDVTDPAVPWPGYLDGVVLQPEGGAVRCWYAGRELARPAP